MTTLTKVNVLTEQQFGGTPYGNHTALRFPFATDSAGKWTDDSAAAPAAVQIGDKCRIGVLPAGMELMSALAIVSDAITASQTCKLGFEYVDGVEGTTVLQDDDYFYAALALSAAGRTAATNTGVRPVVLEKDAYLILTNAGAAANAAGQVDFLIFGVLQGAA